MLPCEPLVLDERKGTWELSQAGEIFVHPNDGKTVRMCKEQKFQPYNKANLLKRKWHQWIFVSLVQKSSESFCCDVPRNLNVRHGIHRLGFFMQFQHYPPPVHPPISGLYNSTSEVCPIVSACPMASQWIIRSSKSLGSGNRRWSHEAEPIVGREDKSTPPTSKNDVASPTRRGEGVT